MLTLLLLLDVSYTSWQVETLFQLMKFPSYNSEIDLFSSIKVNFFSIYLPGYSLINLPLNSPLHYS